MEPLQVPHVFIVHVRADDGRRRKFITEQMAKHQIEFEFMLDGDMSDLNRDNMSLFFTPNLVEQGPTPRESCTYKHLMIYKAMMERNIPEALIFEDDAFLAPNFNEIFNATMREWRHRKEIDSNRLFISYENSMLQFVPQAKRIAGLHLYKASETRCAGAYFMTLPAAQAVYEYTLNNPCNFAIDWQHKTMLDAGLLDVYWCEPPVVEQGSHNGKLPTLLDDKKHGFLRRLSWQIQRFYKRHILFR